jgi:hypothetical protein
MGGKQYMTFNDRFFLTKTTDTDVVVKAIQ